ncbi:hypothetical protein JAAARDRAFT_138560 [Jaapia argillacea MUCL 33604]|uniref:Essential protein Yae1 N-terminal domain-containing protein n=1 Tax=Jaapia argillacea MUCL 33604 TaxID=933084 RepID=A0A067PQ94_9AGAM|nr:hypothetical protein JAAARDRAFT_138560 [Jaapia argillacea MUCL 33604]
MASDFDLESLVNLEQTFYDSGYEDGFNHGRIHGLIEGRALGREKGFEMWEEVGFYEGFAKLWKAIYTRDRRFDDRGLHHAQQLLDLIAQFPMANPSMSDASDLDIPRLFRQIRSRYKVLCATLGVRATLRAGDSSPTREVEEDRPRLVGDGAKRRVWEVQSGGQGSISGGLSF